METFEQVPFLDLITPHRELEDDLLRIASSCLRAGSFVGGSMVTEFEREFAAFCGARFSVGVGSGTDALRFALMAAGVGPGDVVVTVPNTFIATAEAISQAGALPEFVDIDQQTYNMNPEKLREYLETVCVQDADTGQIRSRRSGGRVAAVVPVHLYGQMADMDPILDLAADRNLVVIEDACQAHGAQYFSQIRKSWLKAGSMARAAAFSFYPGKNLGACGEAGIVTTDDKDLASRVQKLRDHGQTQKYFHDCEGYNGRLDAMQAGFLRVKLPYLEQWNAQRRYLAQKYRELFTLYEMENILPYQPYWSDEVYHLFVIRSQERDRLRDRLRERGIATGIHYPIPLHLQKAYRRLNYKPGDFPAAEKVCAEVLSLPMFPSLHLEQQERVVSVIHDFGSTSCGTKQSAVLAMSSATGTTEPATPGQGSTNHLDSIVGSKATTL